MYKNKDKLLNACKSNAKYTFEFKNNLIQFIFTKKKQKIVIKKSKGGPLYIFCPGADGTKGGKPGYS